MEIYIAIWLATLILGVALGIAVSALLIILRRKKDKLQPLIGVVLPRDMKDE